MLKQQRCKIEKQTHKSGIVVIHEGRPRLIREGTCDDVSYFLDINANDSYDDEYMKEFNKLKSEEDKGKEEKPLEFIEWKKDQFLTGRNTEKAICSKKEEYEEYPEYIEHYDPDESIGAIDDAMLSRCSKIRYAKTECDKCMEFNRMMQDKIKKEYDDYIAEFYAKINLTKKQGRKKGMDKKAEKRAIKGPDNHVLAIDYMNVDIDHKSVYAMTLTTSEDDPYMLRDFIIKFTNSRMYRVSAIAYSFELTKKGIPHIHAMVWSTKKYLDAKKIEQRLGFKGRYTLDKVNDEISYANYMLKDRSNQDVIDYCTKKGITQIVSYIKPNNQGLATMRAEAQKVNDDANIEKVD